MEYKTRFHTHVIVGYSMYKIEAAAQFFCICRAAFTFASLILHLPHGFYTLPRGF